MPLPDSIEREKLHDRNIHCEGFKRKDGLWDIEAHMVDLRTYDRGYDPSHRNGIIKAGEPVHDMYVRITIDLDFVIHDALAVSDATPISVCSQAAGVMTKLIGLQIGSGWMREARKRIESTASCTHLMDLLAPLAVTAYQTLHATLDEKARQEKSTDKPKVLNTCLAFASDGEYVLKRWPEFYTGALDKPSE